MFVYSAVRHTTSGYWRQCCSLSLVVFMTSPTGRVAGGVEDLRFGVLETTSLLFADDVVRMVTSVTSCIHWGDLQPNGKLQQSGLAPKIWICVALTTQKHKLGIRDSGAGTSEWNMLQCEREVWVNLLVLLPHQPGGEDENE